MISAVGWVRKGAAKEVPSRYSYQMPDDEEDDAQMEDAGDSSEEIPVVPIDDEVMKKYNLDAYDEEDDMDSMMYHKPGTKDPLLTGDSDDDEKIDMDDLTIRDTDTLLLAAMTEDDQFSHVNVYVYETQELNLYVHHDIVLPSFPLCIEWMGFGAPAKDNDPRLRSGMNSLAIGTFEPEIEVWDLDLLDALTPMFSLGGFEESSQPKMEKKKKGKKKKRPSMRTQEKKLRDGSHTDAIMSLSWNKFVTNVLASGSADTTVKLWNLETQSCLNTFTHHSGKVQSICWHPTEPNLLLSAAYDKTASIVDIRSPNQVYRWKLTADVEVVEWNVHKPQEFFISSEDGIVQCFDSLAPQETHFTLQAHAGAVSGLSINHGIPNCMATASDDKSLKLWDISDHKPQLVYSNDSMNAQLYALSWNPDFSNLLALGGKDHLQVIDTYKIEQFVKHFSEKQ